MILRIYYSYDFPHRFPGQRVGTAAMGMVWCMFGCMSYAFATEHRTFANDNKISFCHTS